MNDPALNRYLSGAMILLILATLFAFGWWFNRYVTALGDDQEGFTWLLVVIGVTVTLVGLGLLDLFIDWNAAMIGFTAFAASGFEMIRGAVLRYIQQRRRLRELV